MAKDVVDEFNGLWAGKTGFQVELVGWEDTVASYGRPQETINLDLAQCELVIGMIWKKWGTPPSLTGPYTSGFEEEYRTSLERRQRHGKPEISLFFKDVDPELVRDPGDELKKVLSFKDEIVRGKIIYFENFVNESDFQGKIRRCVVKYVQRLDELEKLSQPKSNKSETQEIKKEISTDNTDVDQPRFTTEEKTFLQEILTPSSGTTENSLTPLEVARFRLLALNQHTPFNDEQHLGTHDANLIFVDRAALSLGHRERFGLLQSALAQFKSENYPLWYWVAAGDGFNRQILQIWSRIGPAGERANALAAMAAISLSILEEEPKRRKIVDSWFSEKSSDDVKIEALRYLEKCGQSSDIPIVKSEVDRSSYKTRAAAVRCYIKLHSQQSFDSAFKAVLELKNESVESEAVSHFFANGDVLSNGNLEEGLSHSSPAVRLVAARLLRKRRLLSIADAERLIGDELADTRLEALLALVEHGKSYSASEARRVLVKANSTLGGVLGGGLLGGSRRTRDEAGETAFAKFEEHLLGALTEQQLVELGNSSHQIDCSPMIAFVQRSWPSRVHYLRKAIADRFVDFGDEVIARAIKAFGPGSFGATSVEKSRDEMQKKCVRKALDAISDRGDRSDLIFIREQLDNQEMEYSLKDVEFFSRWGEWDDIWRIVAAVDRTINNRASSLLMLGRDDIDYETVGKAIYKIGNQRIGELLNHSFSGPILSALIKSITNPQFRKIPEELIHKLLLSEITNVRKNVCLKIIKTFPRKKVEKYLEYYTSIGEMRYYNVFFFLDMGISIPRDRVTAACENALS